MKISFEKTKNSVLIIVGNDSVHLDARECGEMAFEWSPEPLNDILDRNEAELSPEQERELEDLCLKFYQENREIAVKEQGGNICLWEGLEKDWLFMSDYEQAGFYIEVYPDTELTDEQIVSRLTYGYTN